MNLTTLDKNFEILRKDRQFLLNLISDLSNDQLNKIPNGFNNNIIWNLGHMVASQQGVCYFRGNHPIRISDELFQAYKPGSRPEGNVSEKEIIEIKRLLFSTIDLMEEDYKNDLFANNPTWTNRYGVEHKTIDDSITFLLFHDGLHSGIITALKRVVEATDNS